MQRPPDKDLIRQTLAGDATAFDALIRRHREDARRVARRYLDDPDDALQEAFSEAYLQLAALNDPDRFRQWLGAIVRNRCLSQLRGSHRHVSYEETIHDEEIRFSETTSAPDDSLIERETVETIHTAISRLPAKSRSVTELYYLQSKSYAEIAAELEVPVSTIEGRLYRARKQLKEELLKMADIDHEALQNAIEKATGGLHQDIADLKLQLKAVQREGDRGIDEARKAAGRAITQLPTTAKNPITWTIAGGYRVGDEFSDTRIISTGMSDSIDDHLGRIPDGEIARFAGLFTDPVAVAVLRKLVYGPCAEGDLSALCQEGEKLAQALARLDADRLIKRDGDQIAPVKNAVTFFLTFVSMAGLYHSHIGVPRYGDDASLGVIAQVAQNLAHDIPHPPPCDAFGHFSGTARLITLIQAVPLSLDPERLARFKEGERIALRDLNSAQQAYLRALVESQDHRPEDASSLAVYFDPTHEKDDDHAHIVITADNGQYGTHIDAFAMGTERAGWY